MITKTYQPASPDRAVLLMMAAAQMVLNTAQNGDLFSDSDSSKSACIEAFDVLSRALEETKRALPDMISPFHRYRIEVFANTADGLRLRRLVMNLFDGWAGLHLGQLLQVSDEKYQRIALEMITAYQRNGPREASFVALANEVFNHHKKLGVRVESDQQALKFKGVAA